MPFDDGRPAGSDTRSIEVPAHLSNTKDMATANTTARSSAQTCVYHSHLSVEDSASRILIVSAGVQDRQVLKEVLMSHGCPRYWTATVQEASDWLSGNRARVVICDASLPDGDWRELWEQVRRWPDPPVFIVSAGWTDARLWAEVLNVGAYDVIVKPYEKSEVTRILQHACRSFEHFA